MRPNELCVQVLKRSLLAELVKEYFRQGRTSAGAMGINRKVGNWQGEGGKEDSLEDHVTL